MDIWAYLIRLLITAVAVLITARLLRGVTIDDFGNALWVAFLLGIVNAVIRPILVFFTFPITILTLGLFVLVINTLMIMLVDVVVKGFAIRNFGWAFLFSLILALVNGLLQAIFL